MRDFYEAQRGGLPKIDTQNLFSRPLPVGLENEKRERYKIAKK